MSGETQAEESGWSTDTLRYYMQKQIDTLQAQVDRRLHSEAQRTKGQRGIILQRLSDMDKATELLSATVNKVPSETDLKVGNATRLFSKDMEGVYRLFEEREKRAQSDAIAAKVAVDAALKAAQEAVSEQNKANSTAIAKSEVATQKTIDKNADLVAADTNALRGQIADLKDGIADLRTLVNGLGQLRAGGTATLTQVVAIVAVVAAVAFGIYAIVKP